MSSLFIDREYKKNASKNQVSITKNGITQKNIRQYVQWQDLKQLTSRQVLINMVLPYPFLVLAWLSFCYGYYVLALVGWYAFFVASFRQAHDCYHHNLGVDKKSEDILLFILSALLLTSTHCVRETHLLHHKKPLQTEDIETRHYKVTWYQAILGGFDHWLSLQTQGYKLAKPKNKQKIVLDYLLMVAMLLIAFILAYRGYVTINSNYFVLSAHVLVMSLANMFVGFVAGWLVHRGCDEHNITARTERNPVINALTFNMWYHQEHHLFPAVPANNLPVLAQRIDSVAPELTALRVMSYCSKPKKTFRLYRLAMMLKYRFDKLI